MQSFCFLLANGERVFPPESLLCLGGFAGLGRGGRLQNSFLDLRRMKTRGSACKQRPPEERACLGPCRVVIRPVANVQAEWFQAAEASHTHRAPTSASPLQVPADVEKCQDRMECFNADLKADMERWQNNKRQDFRQLLMGMADKNIQYYEKVMSAPTRPRHPPPPPPH